VNSIIPLPCVSVPDPWDFKRIRIRASVQLDTYPERAFFIRGFQDTTKILLSFKVFYLILTVGTFTSVYKDNRLSRSHKTAEVKVLLSFLVVHERIWIRKNNYGSGRPQNLRIRNTACDILFFIPSAAKVSIDHDQSAKYLSSDWKNRVFFTFMRINITLCRERTGYAVSSYVFFSKQESTQ
jgi:hypothetical protein